MTFESFKNSIVQKERNFKIKNSVGVKQIYRTLKKNNSFKYPMNESLFYKIIRTVHEIMKEELLKGNNVKLPLRMGSFELRKSIIKKPEIINNKLIIHSPINWDKTLKLWYEDEEAKNKKILIRSNLKYKFRLYYIKYNANYKNRSYIKFTSCDSFRKEVYSKVISNNLEAFTLK